VGERGSEMLGNMAIVAVNTKSGRPTRVLVAQCNKRYAEVFCSAFNAGQSAKERAVPVAACWQENDRTGMENGTKTEPSHPVSC